MIVFKVWVMNIHGLWSERIFATKTAAQKWAANYNIYEIEEMVVHG